MEQVVICRAPKLAMSPMKRRRLRAIILLQLSLHLVLQAGFGQAASQAFLERLGQEARDALNRGDFPAAQKAFEQIVKLKPDMAEAHSNLGLSLYAQDRFRDALPHLNRAIQLKPSLDGARAMLGICYFRLNRFGESIEMLEKLKSPAKEDLIVIQHLSIALIKSMEYEKALPVLNRWIEHEPQSVDAVYYKGQASLLLSIQSFERLKQLSPDSYRMRQLQADLFAKQGHLEPAIGEYKKAIEAHPDVPGLHYGLARLYWSNMRLDEALVELQAELRLSPDDPYTNYLLGDIYLQKRDLGAAASHLRKAVEMDPELVEAQMDLASVFRQQGDIKRAIDKLNEVIRMDPDNEGAHYNLFELYRKAGDAKKSEEEFRIFQKLKDKKAR